MVRLPLMVRLFTCEGETIKLITIVVVVVVIIILLDAIAVGGG